MNTNVIYGSNVCLVTRTPDGIDPSAYSNSIKNWSLEFYGITFELCMDYGRFSQPQGFPSHEVTIFYFEIEISPLLTITLLVFRFCKKKMVSFWLKKDRLFFFSKKNADVQPIIHSMWKKSRLIEIHVTHIMNVVYYLFFKMSFHCYLNSAYRMHDDFRLRTRNMPDIKIAYAKC